MKKFEKILKELHEQKTKLSLKLYEYEHSTGTLSEEMLLLSIEKIVNDIQILIEKGRSNDSTEN